MTATLHVRQTVRSYDEWKPVFDDHESSRRQHGASGHRLLRDGNTVTVLIDFPDQAAAEGFGADPSLGEAMSRGGVVGAPDISLLEPAEEITY
jgi:hypothetical protein